MANDAAARAACVQLAARLGGGGPAAPEFRALTGRQPGMWTHLPPYALPAFSAYASHCAGVDAAEHIASCGPANAHAARLLTSRRPDDDARHRGAGGAPQRADDRAPPHPNTLQVLRICTEKRRGRVASHGAACLTPSAMHSFQLQLHWCQASHPALLHATAISIPVPVVLQRVWVGRCGPVGRHGEGLCQDPRAGGEGREGAARGFCQVPGTHYTELNRCSAMLLSDCAKERRRRRSGWQPRRLCRSVSNCAGRSSLDTASAHPLIVRNAQPPQDSPCVCLQCLQAEAASATAGADPVIVRNAGSIGARDLQLEDFSVSNGGPNLIEDASIMLAFGRRYGLVTLSVLSGHWCAQSSAVAQQQHTRAAPGCRRECHCMTPGVSTLNACLAAAGGAQWHWEDHTAAGARRPPDQGHPRQHAGSILQIVSTSLPWLLHHSCTHQLPAIPMCSQPTARQQYQAASARSANGRRPCRLAGLCGPVGALQFAHC